MATKVGAHHLSAIEYGDFAALPDDRSVIRFVRVYAEHLGLDAEAAAVDYARELGEGRPGGDGARPEGDAVPEESTRSGQEAVSGDDARPGEKARLAGRRVPGFDRPWILLAAALLVAVLALLGWWRLAGDSEKEEPPPTRSEPGHAAAGAAPLPDGTASGENDGTLAPQSASGRSPVTVGEYGVGTGVVARGLVGEGSRFTEGEQVWFWTRVSGGSEGETIRHVWFHEGRETARIPLALGGPHWRTQSRKILTPGMTGNWAVEARDATGRVIARSEFVCLPR